MFCPKCAGQNVDGASFCRVCGANISLVPQALTGNLPVEIDDSRAARRDRKRDGRPPSLSRAMRSAFMGLAFVFVALALSFANEGRGWWYWMLIPAFSMLGTGVAEFIRLREEKKRMQPYDEPAQPTISAPHRVSSLPPRNTGQMMPPPPSVTEGTTRHLGAEAPTRHLDASDEFPK